MKRIRVIPVLLVNEGKLVKTVKFRHEVYVGDPINAVKIFNEKEVDELIVLDITATNEKRTPDFSLIEQLASECFMPLAYGGGITSVSDVKQVFDKGIEKVCLNSAAIDQPGLIETIARSYGSQSVVVSVDVKKKYLGKYKAYSHSGKNKISFNILDLVKMYENRGAGEILLNSIDRDGTYIGYDLELIKKVSEILSIPVIACGGASTIDDFSEVVIEGKASAVAAGSMFVFNGKHKAVLISYPSQEELIDKFYSKIE